MARSTAAGISRGVATRFTDEDDSDLIALMVFLSDKTHYPRAALLTAQHYLRKYFTIEQLESRYQQHLDAQRIQPSPHKSRRRMSVHSNAVRNRENRELVMGLFNGLEYGGEGKGAGNGAGLGRVDVVMESIGEEESDDEGSNYGSPAQKKVKFAEEPVKKILVVRRVKSLGDASKAIRKMKGAGPTRVEKREILAGVYARHRRDHGEDVVAQKEMTIKGYCNGWVEMESADLKGRYGDILRDSIAGS